jgi:DNA-binding beta-propeller fold protein YncE
MSCFCPAFLPFIVTNSFAQSGQFRSALDVRHAPSGDRRESSARTLLADGSGLPNLSYPANELFTVIAGINSANGAPRSHGSVSMHKGYLAVIYSADGIFSDGGFSFYDMSNPYSPRLVFRKDDEETDQLREAHGYGYSSSYPGDYVAFQAAFGVQIWDWTDITNPVRLSYLQLPGIEDSDYTLGAWWLCWQAPYIYVGGSGNGIYIVDATDPVNPVLVDRGPGKPNPIPISQTGGFRVGPTFAIGNLLVASSMEGEGYLTMDISDPKNPVLLATQSIGMPNIYSIMVNGNKILSAGNDGFLYVHNIADPSRIVLLNQIAMSGRRGYITFQDGFVHMGGGQNYTKIDIRNDAEYFIVGTATSGVDNRSEDFTTPLGNLVMVSDDHGNGSFIVPHQAEPDHAGPEVNMASPPDSAVNQALTTRVGLTFTDMIDLRSVNNSTFIVRPRGGEPLNGKYSTQTGIVNFFPDSLLQANTVYEIVVPQGGIKDWTGNATPTTFISSFSTGPYINSRLECELLPRAPALVGENVTFTASTTGSVGTIKFSWDFGDGTPTTPFSVDSFAVHIYTQPGHYTVQLTVTDDLLTSHCSGAQTIHYPVSAVLPAASSPIILDAAQNMVWNVNPDNGTATAIDAIGLTKRFEQTVGKEPRTLAQAPDGTIWVVNQADATISVLNRSTGNWVDTIALPYASRPFGIAFSPDGSAGYVTLQATGRLLKLNPSSRSIAGDIAVGSTPKGLAISGDSRRIWVTHFISPADHGEVVEIDAASFSIARSYELALDPGPDTEAGGRGVPNYISSLSISPDGRRVWVPSKKDNTVRGLLRDGLRLTFESTVRTIVSQLDLLNNTEDLASRLDLNNRDMAVAVQFSPLGDYAFVATQGSNTIEVFDAYDRKLITSIENVGRAPQGMILSPAGRDTKLFVHCFMSRSVAVYDVSGIITASNNDAQKLADISTVSVERLPPLVFQGKQIFYNAKDSRMNLDGYLSCASCHLDGDDDGRVWDFTDRGEGLRNTISLLGRRGAGQGRVHWSANFDEIQDFEHDIRNAFGGSGFMSDAAFNTGTRNHPLGDPKAGISPELDALAAYLESLDQAPPSPYRNADGSLTADGAAGKTLFQQLNCAACHAGNDFTDSGSRLMHDVGTIKPSSGQRLSAPLMGLDTPTLRGLWQTPPYLHDGSAATLMDVLTAANPNGIHGNTLALSPAQKQQLAAYLSQIDNLEPPAPDAAPAVVLTSPLPDARFTDEEQVAINVDAASSIGSISKIEFYSGAAKLGEDACSPYSFVWTGGALGAHTLTARAIHRNGIKTLSAPVTINIVSAAPTISNVAIAGISTQAATIIWNTDEASDSQVEYGLDTNYGNSSPLDPNLVTAHAITLSGLAVNTTYHFRMKSRNAVGNLATSGDFTFTTSSFDVTLEAENMPIKTTGTLRSPGWLLWDSGYIAQDVTFPAAGLYKFTLRAQGNLVAGDWSQAELRLDQAPQTVITVDSPTYTDFVVEMTVGAGTHEVAIAFINDYWDPPDDRNLWVDWLRLQSTGPTDTQPPVISNVASSNITNSAATVAWATNEASDSQVEYGLTTSYGSSSPLNSLLVTSHTVVLSSLQANATYHYRVKSKDGSGNLAVSNDFTFTTAQITGVALTSPNGGEWWFAGANQQITWNGAGAIANVKLEFSRNGGATWRTIVASTPNSGSYNWQVPDTVSNACLIRVSDAANANVTDVSNGTFFITLEALINFTPSAGNPVLNPGTAGSWDENIRERGWFMYENGTYHLWYGGWQGPYDHSVPQLVKLGYAYSSDGVNWTKYAGNPIQSQHWTEDVVVVKDGNTYYLYAEDEHTGDGDGAFIDLYTSTDKINWTRYGTILRPSGTGWEESDVGTPTVWKEGTTWYMLYEGLGFGIAGQVGLATSSDGKNWTRYANNPVLSHPFSASLDIAIDSIVKINGVYYAYGHYDSGGQNWVGGLFTSTNLTAWTAYPGNPIVYNSSVIVATGANYYLYGLASGTLAPYNMQFSSIAKDANPPTISSVAAGNLTTSAATITWTTNEVSDSQVEYGLTTSYGSASTLNPALVTSHTVALSSLQVNTTYHYRVKSKDASGNLAVSNDFTFTTVSSPPPLNLKLEAENMPIKTVGGAELPGWKQGEEGYIAQNVSFPAAGLYKFTLRAYSNFVGGDWAQAELRLDQAPQAVISVNSSAYTDFVVEITVGAGTHEVAVAFINDYWDPPDDRGLWVDWLRIETSGALAKFEARPSLPSEALPSTLALQNYPNPFNAATRISLSLPHDAEIHLSIYDLAGREVQELMAGSRAAGYYKITWDGRNREGSALSSGVYLLRLRYRAGESGAWSQLVRRVLMVK